MKRKICYIKKKQTTIICQNRKGEELHMQIKS